MGEAAAQFAVEQVGKCYAEGDDQRKGPECFDASGLVFVAWEKQGIKTFPETTYDYESSKLLDTVEADQVREGDVLFKDNHVAIFVGNSTIVEAKQDEGVVQTSFEEFNQTAIYRPKAK